jgi:hypothetical protein
MTNQETAKKACDLIMEAFTLLAPIAELPTIEIPAPDLETDEPAGPSIDAVRAKVGDAIIKTSAETVHEVFKNYGIARVSDFRPEQYENLIEALDELIEGATNETDA